MNWFSKILRRDAAPPAAGAQDALEASLSALDGCLAGAEAALCERFRDALPGMVVGLVRAQLAGLPARMASFCERDDFSLGYAVALTHNLAAACRGRNALDVPLEAVFTALHAGDGDALCERAVRKLMQGDCRASAGACAGRADVSEWLQRRGGGGARLRDEFSLAAQADGVT